MKIVNVIDEQLEIITVLFDEYRQFYKQASDVKAAKDFISERLANKDSQILLALSDEGEGLGFVQLYPAFSSVAMKPMWYLNDLYVTQASRGLGVAEALLETAQEFAKASGAVTVKLATAVDNIPAKTLYEKIGYLKITAFDHYSRKIET